MLDIINAVNLQGDGFKMAPEDDQTLEISPKAG